jgi:hypothetical protein
VCTEDALWALCSQEPLNDAAVWLVRQGLHLPSLLDALCTLPSLAGADGSALLSALRRGSTPEPGKPYSPSLERILKVAAGDAGPGGCQPLVCRLHETLRDDQMAGRRATLPPASNGWQTRRFPQSPSLQHCWWRTAWPETRCFLSLARVAALVFPLRRLRGWRAGAPPASWLPMTPSWTRLTRPMYA